MRLSIGEAADLLGVSIRTLRYYDEIGLLKPCEISEAGYRYYNDENIALMQQILFYRELQIPLKDIIHILSQPDYEQKQALKMHRELLVMKQKHISGLIRLADDTLGGNQMKRLEISAKDIDNAKSDYAKEVIEKWGRTAEYKECSEKHSAYSHEKEAEIAYEADKIFSEFAAIRNLQPESREAQDLAEK